MKNLILGTFALGLIMLAFSCKKDATTVAVDNTALMTAIASSTEKQTVEVAQLPTSLREYVSLSFNPIAIESAWLVSGRGYEVELEDGQNLYFRTDGNCLGAGTGGGGGVFRCMNGDTVDVSELPQAAADYVTANFPSLTIQTVVFKSHGDRTGYAVELSDGTILLFNADGEYVHTCGDFDEPNGGGGHGGHGGGHHGDGNGPNGPGGGCAAGDTIQVADLPQAATDYVTTNYPSETITLAVVKPSGKFGVELSNGEVLLFEADGTFIKVCDGQPNGGPHNHHCNTPLTALTDLPQAAQDYIAANYPGETLERGCVKNNGNYILELSNDVKILFAADGTVIFDSGN